jgi:hypothetical protein
MTRGVRNNNPGNIRWGCVWQGLKVGGKELDKDFCVFIEPEYGIRAMAKILLNYSKLYKINTVAGIIHRWAPPSENNTVAYINHIANELKTDPDETIDVSNNDVMMKLIKAIIKHENGKQPYTDEIIMKGIELV